MNKKLFAITVIVIAIIAAIIAVVIYINIQSTKTVTRIAGVIWVNNIADASDGELTSTTICWAADGTWFERNRYKGREQEALTTGLSYHTYWRSGVPKSIVKSKRQNRAAEIKRLKELRDARAAESE